MPGFKVTSEKPNIEVILGVVSFGASGAISDQTDLEGASIAQTGTGQYEITLDRGGQRPYAFYSGLDVAAGGDLRIFRRAGTFYDPADGIVSMICVDTTDALADPPNGSAVNICIFVKS